MDSSLNKNRPHLFRLSPIAAVIASAFLCTHTIAAAQTASDNNTATAPAVPAAPLAPAGSATATDPQAVPAPATPAALPTSPAVNPINQTTEPPAATANSATTNAAPGTPAASVAPAESAASDQAAQTEAPRELGSVVVRSRNRLEKLQDVPLSISVVAGNELERTNTTDIKEIAQRVSNVSWNQGNQRTSSISIRGIGKVGQTEAQDPSVGVIVDGVNYAYNALTSSFDFVDIESVEVLRGPQGTLLGKNSNLGTLIFNTRKPSFTPSADYTLSFRERDGFQGTLAAGGPISDQLAWRGVFSANKGQGDIRNGNDRDQTFTNTDRVSGRVQFLLQPDPTLSARLAVDVQPRAGETTNGRTINTPTPTVFSNGSVNARSTDASTRLSRRWFNQDPSYTYQRDFLYGGPGGDSVNYDYQRALVSGSNGATVDVQKKLGGFTLTSISAYKDYHFNSGNDEGTPFDVYRNAGGFYNDYKQISQEIRLTSPLGSFVDYQTGLYYIKVDNDVDYRRIWGNDAGAWFASNAQYARLDADPAGRYLMQNSLDRLSMSYNSPAGVQKIRNESVAGYAQANWKLASNVTLTTGLRATYEDRSNRASSNIKSNGNGAELNPAEVNGVGLGGFNSDATGALLAGNNAQQLALADLLANKYFGVAAGAAPGDAYNSLTAAQRQQVADAKAIRRAQIGVLFNERDAEKFRDVQPAYVISPSWKINEQVTGYVSWQYGEKAGISQFVNGNSALVRPERTTSYELGFKTLLLNRALTFNTALFQMRIKDYQQSVRVVDQYTTDLNRLADPSAPTAFISATGNAPEVEVKGLEVDLAYTGLSYTTLRFAGAYNDAKYKRFTNSAQPVEGDYPGAAPFRDVSGQQLAGAPKYSFNLGADVRVPVWSDKEIFASTNVAFASRYKSDNALSDYSWIPSSTTVDLATGIGTRNKNFAVSLLVKNLLDDDTPRARTWNTYTPAYPRTFGILFAGKV